MAQRSNLPHGTVSFLFTDIAGSTRLWQSHREAMERAYTRHDALLRGAITANRGVIYKTIGDAVQAAFPTVPKAVAAALAAQRALVAEDWSAVGLPEPLRIRMALHVGDVDPDPDGDYRSPVLNRVGRLLSAGHGGQILLSQAAYELARDHLPEGAGLRDLGEQRLKDLARPERVWQVTHPDLPHTFPPLVTLAGIPNNLPLQPTPFLGREREVAEVMALLRRPEVRLLTLTGPGGTGKTRLGLQVAAEVLEQYPDGVWFVPLAPLTDPALVLSAMSEALGVREEGGRPLQERLAEVLAPKQLLLVLDNVEHLLGAATMVGEVLAAAPGLTVLATSRMPLRLRAEREYAVPPLGLPRRKPPPTLEQLSQYEAVRLFIDRAQAVKADFAITNETAPAVAEICWRLDGLPLAIELAAARVRMLPAQAMLARLEKRLSLLTGGARDAPERQQTLRQTIAWSYHLLDPEEQQLFRRLAVFAGGCTLEAAEAVGNHDGALDVFGSVERLVEHSLLRQAGESGSEPRFTMLETIREFALEQLVASGEADEVRQRHATFFLALSEQAAPELMIGAVQGRWTERLETEHDNLRAALAWSVGQEPEIGLRLAGALSWFWWLRGHLSEGRRWLEQVLLCAASDGPYRATALTGAGMLATLQGDYDGAQELARQAVDLARETRDRAALVWALDIFGSVAGYAGDIGRMTAAYEEAIATARVLGDPWWLGFILYTWGIQVQDAGPAAGGLDLAEACFREGLTITRTLGPSSLLAYFLNVIGEIHEQRGQFRQAHGLYLDALAMLRETGDVGGLCFVLQSLATSPGTPVGSVRGVRLIAAAAAVQDQMVSVLPPVQLAKYENRLAEIRLQLGESTFSAAWEEGQALTLDEAIAEALALADELMNAIDA